jgi:hypothetical protein
VSSGSAYLVLGIRCKRSDFFVAKRTISVCAKGHDAGSSREPYCAKDGTPFKATSEEEPTEAFVNWSLANDMDGNGMWEALVEEYGDDIGIHNVSPVASGEDSSKVRKGETSIAFGYKLLEQQGERSGREGMPVTMAALAKRTKDLKELAKTLGIDGEPKLYLTFYW